MRAGLATLVMWRRSQVRPDLLPTSSVLLCAPDNSSKCTIVQRGLGCRGSALLVTPGFSGVREFGIWIVKDSGTSRVRVCCVCSCGSSSTLVCVLFLVLFCGVCVCVVVIILFWCMLFLYFFFGVRVVVVVVVLLTPHIPKEL